MLTTILLQCLCQQFQSLLNFYSDELSFDCLIFVGLEYMYQNNIHNYKFFSALRKNANVHILTKQNQPH